MSSISAVETKWMPNGVSQSCLGSFTQKVAGLWDNLAADSNVNQLQREPMEIKIQVYGPLV